MTERNYIMICKTTFDLSKVAHRKGRNYAEIDGIRIVFEDGVLEGWYNPGAEDSAMEQMTPSEDGVA